jgi:hypothetical protein
MMTAGSGGALALASDHGRTWWSRVGAGNGLIFVHYLSTGQQVVAVEPEALR